MKKLLEALRRYTLFNTYPTSKEFIKYSLIGVVNTSIDFGIYIALTRGFTWWEEHYLLANGISFIIAVTASFYANSIWTFNKKERNYYTQYPKFIIVNIAALLLSQILLYVFVSIYMCNDVFGKVFATVVVILWRFSLYKYWIFK